MTSPDQSESALRTRVESVIAWIEEQQGYCCPPGYAHLSGEELDRLRGPSAAYGATVYGLVLHHLRRAMDEEQAR